jgi:hypothetical protein
LEPTLLDELICHIASLASVYHKVGQVYAINWLIKAVSEKAVPIYNLRKDLAPKSIPKS